MENSVGPIRRATESTEKHISSFFPEAQQFKVRLALQHIMNFFLANEYEPIVTANSDGTVKVIENANHNSVHYDETSIQIIKEWLVINSYI